MTGDLQLRAADLSESEALAALYGRSRAAAAPAMPPGLHTAQEDRAWFAARLRDGEHHAWVAEQDGVLLGYALLTATWLDHLFVEPDGQGAGVGSLLLDAVKGLRPDGFCLWVFESNAPARSFYARRGLVELERTDGSGNEEKSPDVKIAVARSGAGRVLPRSDRRGRPLGGLLSPAARRPGRPGREGHPGARPRTGAGDRRADVSRGPRARSRPPRQDRACRHLREPRRRGSGPSVGGVGP